MATNPDQHTSDYEQLQTTLELYPSIVLSQVEGNPPDSYEIEYHLKGFVRNPDGTITTANLHRVRISLPFGYPHFAPTVKPLTHIFHPDIDPAAIRIADLWQKNPNLSDLVLSIGEMICGNNFSTEDPFNQEAADWYEQHRNELPLDVLQIADIDDTNERFDTLDEDTFSSLGLDEEDLFGAETAEHESKVDLFHLQISQKNIFAAAKILADIPQTVKIPDRDQIEEHIATALKKSDQLFKQAEELEDQGKLDEAAAKLEELNTLVADYPGMDQLRNRILQSQSLADSFSVDTPAGPTEEQRDSGQATPPPITTKRKKARISAKSPLSIKALIVAIIVGIVLVAGGLLYMQDKKILTKGENDWQNVQALINNRQFDDAQAEAESIVRDMDNLLLLKSAGNALTKKVTTLLNSDDFQQGLLGNVRYGNEYVSFAKAEKLKHLARMTDKAETLLKQGKIRAALAAYRQGLVYARKNDLTVKALELAQTINNLRLEEALATAKKAEREKEWENAVQTYKRALQMSQALSDTQDAKEIAKRLAAATFKHELNQSKQAFTGAQWQQTIAMLEHAKTIMDENPTAVTDKDREELQQLLINSRLYQLLTLAREAYERHDLATSITNYQKTLTLLDTHKEDFEPGVLDAYKKIQKTLLMLQIAQGQERAIAAKNRGDLNAVLEQYNTILQRIKSSPFNGNDDLRQLKNDINKQITETRKELEIRHKIDYLTRNFRRIFKRHYPAFAGSKLDHPRVTFKKKVGRKQVFTLICTEHSHGSSSLLELNYMYDPSTGRWSLYTGQ